MKVIKENINEKLKVRRLDDSIDPINEDSNMPKYHLVYTVDGNKSEQTISAVNIQKAMELVKSQFEGKNVNFISKQEVKENLKEAYNYKVSYDDLIEIQGKIDRLIRKMADNHQDEISPSSNTYRIGLPFIGTSEGYIDLQNMNQYIEGYEDEWDNDEDYDESLEEKFGKQEQYDLEQILDFTENNIKIWKKLLNKKSYNEIDTGYFDSLYDDFKHTFDKIKNICYRVNPERFSALKNESLKENYEYVKRAFAFDIYKDGDDFVLLNGDGDEVYRSDNTLDCLKWAKKNSSKYYKADMSFDLDSWNNDFLHEDVESPEKVIENEEKVPQTDEEVGLANMIIKEINGEWETISNYNDLISLMRAEGQDDMIDVISDIVDEENKHVGQLQKCLQIISPNVSEIDSGESEAKGQLNAEEQLIASAEECVDCADDDFGENSGFEMYLV